MTATEKQTFLVGEAGKSREIAFHQHPAAQPDGIGLFWMGGYKSNMDGSKALALDAFAERAGLGCTRYDYSGHGASGGAFTDGTISKWLEESLAMFDQQTSGPQIVIGSSMGGWLALLLVKAHIEQVGIKKSRIKGVVLIAPAVDMTKDLMWDIFDQATRAELAANGVFRKPSEYGEPYEITRELIVDGEQHLLGDRLIQTGCPVRILQGVQDDSVPWQASVDLVSRLAQDDVRLTLVKDGDHSLSREHDLALLVRVVEQSAMS
ncbi:Pimeloyl-ACP methyl ester carboxylesterase [Cohaesibacter sp. ES.047]|uniref:alpha/beta hydrolase n=1 Tax=Cohaesibacter sp. ES.047 TaxID=1798205 RepID=UPI000BB8C388|nr:alpha/beta hydrolase [Cohaesibacter sp. ES.047]SNY90348.1 Pimeloyl-ACP methyl ester carboxylesterase [Cohaesibacter sp. ES.047]